ncbi:MAG: S8 family serine peptidase [Anaerolineae bacterium]|nr:S8 family serine peptidase [Anaerolineae bacterium]
MKMKIRWQSALVIVPAAMLFMVAVARFSGSPAAGMEQPPPAAPASLEAAGPAPTDQLIIKFRANGSVRGDNAPAHPRRMQQLSTAAGLELTYGRAMSGDARVLRLPAALPLAQVEAIARRLETLADVEYAEPDSRLFPLAEWPDDPEYLNQWHYFDTYGINAPAAWEITIGSSSIRIAVIDTGITDHADLAGRWLGGYDFISNLAVANDGDLRDSDPRDPGDWVVANECYAGSQVHASSWHGTHVAGTIGAKTHNGLGVAGVNWVSPIVPVRVMGKCGGYLSDIVDGLRWAAGLAVTGLPANGNPARVLNMSLGAPGECHTSYQGAIDAANAAGAIIVVAAGNSNLNLDISDYQPANCNGVITVAATDRGGDRAYYSNYGRTVDISAPGGENVPSPSYAVLSTLNSGLTVPTTDTYVYYQGTSMSAPQVAGVISLLLSFDPTLTRAEIVALLQETARPFPAGSSCTTAICGSGIVNAGAALATFGGATPQPMSTPTPTPTSTPTSGPVYLPVVTGH